MKAPAGQVAVAAGFTVLGALILWGSFYLPAGGGYAQVGPGVVPRAVGVVMLVVGAFLVREAFTGGFRGVDEEAEVHLPMDWIAFAWVSGGIIAYGVLIEYLGFIFSSTILFLMVARGFNSRAWVVNIVTGIVLASIVYGIFNYGLGLTLPAGVLKGIV